MENSNSTRVFRFSVHPWYWALLFWGLTMWPFFGIMLVSWTTGMADESRGRALIATVALWAVCQSGLWFHGKRLLLLAERGEIRLDDAGMTVTDWRGRRNAFAWEAIEEAFVPYGTPFAIAVKAGRKWTRIPGWVEDEDDFVGQVVRRASLDTGVPTRVGVRYIRGRPERGRGQGSDKNPS